MAKFEMIKYHGLSYSNNIPLRIEEIATHFDVKSIDGVLGYSLHTEYSYGKRRFDSDIINEYPELVLAQKDGVPQLWKNSIWASQFADFIICKLILHFDPSLIETDQFPDAQIRKENVSKACVLYLHLPLPL